jgi:hypothetical protein
MKYTLIFTSFDVKINSTQTLLIKFLYIDKFLLLNIGLKSMLKFSFGI